MNRLRKTSSDHTEPDERDTESEISEVLALAPDVPLSVPGTTEPEVQTSEMPYAGRAKTVEPEEEIPNSGESTKVVKFLGEVDSEDSESSSDESTASCCSDEEFDEGFSEGSQGKVASSASNAETKVTPTCKEENYEIKTETDTQLESETKSDLSHKESKTEVAVNDKLETNVSFETNSESVSVVTQEIEGELNDSSVVANTIQQDNTASEESLETLQQPLAENKRFEATEPNCAQTSLIVDREDSSLTVENKEQGKVLDEAESHAEGVLDNTRYISGENNISPQQPTEMIQKGLETTQSADGQESSDLETVTSEEIKEKNVVVFSEENRIKSDDAQTTDDLNPDKKASDDISHLDLVEEAVCENSENSDTSEQKDDESKTEQTDQQTPPGTYSSENSKLDDKPAGCEKTIADSGTEKQLTEGENNVD